MSGIVVRMFKEADERVTFDHGHVDLRGVAVHLAARIMDAAGPSEVFVSATTKELASGAGIEFADRGSREFKGFGGERQVFEAIRRDG